jgi:hypothetical protein
LEFSEQYLQVLFTETDIDLIPTDSQMKLSDSIDFDDFTSIKMAPTWTRVAWDPVNSLTKRTLILKEVYMTSMAIKYGIAEYKLDFGFISTLSNGQRQITSGKVLMKIKTYCSSIVAYSGQKIYDVFYHVQRKMSFDVEVMAPHKLTGCNDAERVDLYVPNLTNNSTLSSEITFGSDKKLKKQF